LYLSKRLFESMLRVQTHHWNKQSVRKLPRCYAVLLAVLLVLCCLLLFAVVL
jgi:hypothetical protein